MKKLCNSLTSTIQLNFKKGLTLATICLLVLTSNVSWGQTWTVLYDEVSTPTFFAHTHDNETVLEKFDTDNGTKFPSGELVMFRSVDDPLGANYLMVSLIDKAGNEFFGASDVYPASSMLSAPGPGVQSRLVPVAAAYNDGHLGGRPKYIVCGYGTGSNSGNVELWYMTFNENLELVNAESFGITASNFPQLGVDCDVFVTDVTASYVNQQPDRIDFAFTGKICPVGQARNAFKATSNAGSYTFLCEVNTDNPGIIEGFFCPSLSSGVYDNDKETFPAFISEVRTMHGNGENDGYILGGTIVSRDHDPDNYPYFIVRTGYNMHQPGVAVKNPIQIANGYPVNTNNNNNYSCYANQFLNPIGNLNGSKLNLQEAIYDHNVESIVMAGSFLHKDIIGGIGLQGFFVDQIEIVSNNISIPTSLTTLAGFAPFYHYPSSYSWVSGPNTRGVGILFNPNDDLVANFHVQNPIVDGIFYDQSSFSSTFHVGGKLFGDVYSRLPGGVVSNLPLTFEVDYKLVTNSTDWTTFGTSNIGLFPRDMSVNSNITPGSHSLKEKQFQYSLSKHNQSLSKYENGRMSYFLGGLGNYPYNSNSYDQTVLNKVVYDNASNSFASNCLTHSNALFTENYSTAAYPINNDPWANSGITTAGINSSTYSFNQPNSLPFRVENCSSPTYFKKAVASDASNSENIDDVLVWQSEKNIYWKGDCSNIKSMVIYDLNGAKIRSIPENAFQTYSYTLNQLASGMYLLKIDYYEGQSHILKIQY